MNPDASTNLKFQGLSRLEMEHQAILSELKRTLSCDDVLDVYEMEKERDRKRILLHKLERIEQALERNRLGIYGLCESCNQAIHEERLLAIPYIEYCVDCQIITMQKESWIYLKPQPTSQQAERRTECTMLS